MTCIPVIFNGEVVTHIPIDVWAAVMDPCLDLAAPKEDIYGAIRAIVKHTLDGVLVGRNESFARGYWMISPHGYLSRPTRLVVWTIDCTSEVSL